MPFDNPHTFASVSAKMKPGVILRQTNYEVRGFLRFVRIVIVSAIGNK